MPRIVSAPALAALLAENTAEVFLTTLKISGGGITPLYFVNDLVDVTIDSIPYIAFPFDLTMPTDDPDKPPVARIRVANATREIIDEIRAATGVLQFEISIRLASSPSIIEYGPWELDGSAVSYDVDIVEVDLRGKDFSQEPFPYIRFTPSRFPGIFR